MIRLGLVWVEAAVISSAVDGRFSPNSTSDVGENSATVVRGIAIALSGSLKSALFGESIATPSRPDLRHSPSGFAH